MRSEIGGGILNFDKKNKEITFNDIIWVGLNSAIISWLILFIGMNMTLEEFLPNLLLPGWKTFILLPITYLLTTLPFYLINQKPSIKETNNISLDKQLLSFSTSKLAIIYLITCSSEELLFRVAIQGSIAKFISSPIAIILASIIFALMHFRYIKYWELTLVIIWVGIIWGVLYVITGSWIMVSLAHFTNNFTISYFEKKKLK